MVSTATQILLIEAGVVVESLDPPLPDFEYIFPLYGKYLVVGRSGVLYWSNTLKFDIVNKCSLFHQTPFNLVCRSGNILAFSSFTDITQLKVTRSKEVQPQLSSDEVVLIEKEEVVALFDKVR